jgi:hypothetical protein
MPSREPGLPGSAGKCSMPMSGCAREKSLRKASREAVIGW